MKKTLWSPPVWKLDISQVKAEGNAAAPLIHSHTDAPRLAKEAPIHLSLASLEALEAHFTNGAVGFLYNVKQMRRKSKQNTWLPVL